MKNNKIITPTTFAVAFLSILIVSIVFFTDNDTKNFVEQVDSIMTTQESLEADFEIAGYSLDNPNVILNPYEISPLTALVIFETENEETPKVIVKGENSRDIEGFGKKGKEHYIPVYGLYPDKDNKVIIKIGDKSKELTISTNSLPEDMSLPVDITASDSIKNSDEFYFFTPSSEGYTSAYDSNGNVRWYLTKKMVWDISRLANGNLALSTERSINPPYFTTGLYEMDLLGKVYNEYNLPGGYHHDYFELDNGNLLVASNEFDNEFGTVEDVIVELDRKSGEIIKTWDLKESLDMDQGKSENWSEYDWFHNNSVWYDKKENEIILSGRHQDAVIAIDYDTGDLQWIIGDPVGWAEEYQEYFFEPLYYFDTEVAKDETSEEYVAPIYNRKFEWQWSQHAAMVTPEGYIFILDNGNNKSKIEEEYIPAEESYTRGVMYDIDRESMTIEQVWQHGKERGSEFYSPYISDVDYLGENHYMVHSGGIVHVDGKISNQPAGFYKDGEEIDLYSTTVELMDDEVIFEMTLPTNMYRVEKMSLYNDSNFELKEAGRLGSLGETKADKVYKGSPKDTVDIDEEYKDKEINISKEEDRLIFNGVFNKSEKVRLTLSDNNSSREYNVRVTEKPYTALCIDVFSTFEDDSNLEVNKYINSEGLNGIYSIYITIGDKVYDTNLQVNY